MRRYLFTFLLLVFAVSLTAFSTDRWWQRLNQPTVLCPGCNVIIIDIDTFRADAFDCKGKPGDSGYPPNLCEFVKDAFKFENNFSQSHWTLPSSVSTHTGLYPPEHGIEQYGDFLPAESKMVILPEVLQKNGYKTFKIGYDGRYFISNHSNTDGGYESVINSEDMAIWKIETKKMSLFNNQFYTLFYFGSLHVPYILDEDNPILGLQNRSSFFPITKKEFDKSINDFLLANYDAIFTNEARTVPKSELLEFFYSIRNNRELVGKYLLTDWDTTYYSKIISALYKQVINKDPNSAEKIHEVYNSNINETDEQFSLFLDELKSSGIIKNSIIVFMSDHGEAFNEHGIMEHIGSLFSQYNEIIHVPLYILIPRVKGNAIKKVSENIDIFPTIFELIGIDDAIFAKQIHGKSLVPLMDVRRKWWDNLKEQFAISFSGSLVSIQNNKRKLIIDLCDDSRLEVYDLDTDPAEKRKMSDSAVEVQAKFMNELENTFGFSLKGLGINWEEKFKLGKESDRNTASNCFTN